MHSEKFHADENFTGSKRDREKLMYDNWTYLKDAVQQRWGRLDDATLDDIDGHDERLLDRIQIAYAINRDLAELQLDEFMDEYHDYFVMVRDRAPATPIAPRPHT